MTDELVSAIGASNVLIDTAEVATYEFDGFGWGERPAAVVFPRSVSDVQAILAIASRHHLPVTPRGAGTGLSGGALAVDGGILAVFTRMNHILEIDVENRIAIVEPGVVNLDLSRRIEPLGLFYAPDPSSQKACTLGGNVAENAGGPHCLAYGVTTNHVLAVEVVLPDGEVTVLGSCAPDPIGYDLRGLFIGSEGTFGIATRIWLRLTPLPVAVQTVLATFDDTEGACRGVSAIIAAGLMPAALEVIDAATIGAVNAAMQSGYPADAGAVLLLELDGTPEKVSAEMAEVRRCCLAAGAQTLVSAETVADREALWAGRKGALAALGRLAPSYVLQDAVVPRSSLPGVLRQIVEVAATHTIRIANVFHAGDGNLHPFLFFDPADASGRERVHACEQAIMRICVDAGGTITGEHGVGNDKAKYMSWIFSERDLALMAAVRDVWNPTGLLNPGKLLPTGASCIGMMKSLDGVI